MTELELFGRKQVDGGDTPRWTRDGHLQPVVLEGSDSERPDGWSPQAWRLRTRDDEDAP